MEGKKKRIDFVKEKVRPAPQCGKCRTPYTDTTPACLAYQLSASEMIFSVPSEGLTVSESAALRESMPEGTTVSLIKNKLMQRAIEGDGNWEPTGELLKGTNMWFFVESDISGSLKAFKKFTKEYEKSETNSIKGGVMDGGALDPKAVDAVGKLPSKMELYARIAGGINLVPTKLARVVKVRRPPPHAVGCGRMEVTY